MGFLKFLHEDILPFILKSDKAGFWEIIFFFFFFFFFFCLDNWVNETNLDRKRNIRHFIQGNITFCALMVPHN